MPWLVAGANGLTRLETLLLKGPIPALFVHLPPCPLWNPAPPHTVSFSPVPTHREAGTESLLHDELFIF